ncbi:dynamin family protein [Microcystis aeruginosa]|uniref:dynamin family protein n=1 Tax=Microcystis aeruginosa TaxID=1126 RepID=UPI0023315842|nr:dynamin family protein [Microcystis aeruginosa]MDB9433992.1 dynamin family protein [Microcystis aeruginosa CS-552/01]
MIMHNNHSQQIPDNSQKIQSTIQQFQEYFAIYESVFPYLPIKDTEKSSIEKRKDWISKLKQTEFHVAFLGSYSAGKSTIINGILGREILPEANTSTTAFPTIVKKGEKDQAFIYFMDDKAQRILYDSFITEIGHKIGKNLSRESHEPLGKHFQSIQEAIKQYETETGSSIDQQALGKSRLLVRNLANPDPDYQGRKEIQLSELGNYVEGYEGAIYVDKIEVFVENLNIADGIVLVDLPGLGVDNKRHKEFTQDYIKEKAKAFVVCINPFKVLQGEEIEFLAEINKKNPTIIQRAFWVINQWDIPNKTQKKEAINSFNQRVGDYNFIIKKERNFQTSALNYLLLKTIAQGTIDQSKKLPGHLETLIKTIGLENEPSKDQAKDLLLNHPDIVPFSQFLESLYKYLNKEAKDEFIADARKELLEIIRKLERLLKEPYHQYSQISNLQDDMKIRAVSSQSRFFIDQLKKKVEEFSRQIRTHEDSQFWKESDTHEMIRELDKKIMQIDKKELKNYLSKGEDINGHISRLPNFVTDKIKLTSSMRKRLISVVYIAFTQRLSTLLSDLQTINLSYLPEEVSKKLEDNLSERDISMRLSGMADALFYQYGDELETIGLSLKDCSGQTFSERLDQALKMYKDKLEECTKKLVKELNTNIWYSLKNHAEYLEEKLLELFNDCQDEISSQIAQTIKLDEAIASEVTKQTMITNSYQKLITLQSSIKSSLGTQIPVEVEQFTR